MGVARGRPAVERPPTLEIVAVKRRLLAHVIDDQDLVGQVEHEVALIGRTRQAQLHRLELEYEVVAEGAIKPEMLVLGAGKQLAQ